MRLKDATIKYALAPIVLSTAFRAADNCVTISIQSFPCYIIPRTPLICPSILFNRLMTVLSYSILYPPIYLQTQSLIS